MSFRGTIKPIINPFELLAGWKSLWFGLSIILLNAFLGTAINVHYDGVLDIHMGRPNPFALSIFEHTISWLSLALFLYLSGMYFSSSRIRLIDVLGTTALARYPLLLAIPVGFIDLNDPATIFVNSTSTLTFIGVAILLLFIVGLHIFLLFKAYRVSCNLKGKTLYITFIASVVLAEILSKFLIIQFYKSYIL